MDAIKKASLLRGFLQTGENRAIYRYVVENISYDYDKINNIPTTYVPDIDEIIRDGKGSAMTTPLFCRHAQKPGYTLQASGIPQM